MAITGIEQNVFQDFIFFIPSGGTTSTKLYSEGSSGTFPANYNSNPRLCLVGLFTPAALTSTTLAIQVSHDGITWVPVHVAEGTAYSVTVGPGRYVAIPPAISIGWGYIRIVGIAEAADRQIVARFQVV